MYWNDLIEGNQRVSLGHVLNCPNAINTERWKLMYLIRSRVEKVRKIIVMSREAI